MSEERVQSLLEELRDVNKQMLENQKTTIATQQASLELQRTLGEKYDRAIEQQAKTIVVTRRMQKRIFLFFILFLIALFTLQVWK